ncbi:hypothetical protein [Actibacterium pelagium]|uniref:hypothetical protein n=1 Tax=Actibacterium pelagium TaxID=2029103 RepID=UPI001E31460F|nr:hypothetical protein [Actibacterium pelagium]
MAQPTPAPIPDRPISEPVVAEDRKPKGGSVEDSILGILREEAEREQRARAEDREAASSAVSKLSEGLQAPNPDSERDGPSGPDLGERPKPDTTTETVDNTATSEDADRLRDGGLTDEVRISQTLKEVTANLPNEDGGAGDAAKGGSGFSRGFAMVIVLFGLGMVCYTFASTIVSYVPQAEPYLQQYIVFVDEMRLKLDEMIINLVAMIEAKTGS